MPSGRNRRRFLKTFFTSLFLLTLIGVMLIPTVMFSFTLLLMDGLLSLSKKLKKLFAKTTAHTGRTHHRFLPMHNIIYVEKMEINNKGDLEVTAILENEGKRQGMTYIDQAPEVAPIRAKTTIFKEAFPARTILQNTDPEEMVRLIEDYKLFLHQEWKPVRSEVESNEGDKPQQGGRLFF